MWLRKSIPVQAGLGGGSADAAAALAAVRRLLDVDIDAERLAALAAGVGSDVPFCLTGGAAWLRGRGELVEPVQLAGPLVLALALPPLQLATPDVYAAWDELGGPIAQRRVQAPPAVAPLAQELSNDLELAAERGRATPRGLPRRPRGRGGRAGDPRGERRRLRRAARHRLTDRGDRPWPAASAVA